MYLPNKTKTMIIVIYLLDNKLIWREYNDNNETREKDNEIADTDITAAAHPDHRGVESVVTRHAWGEHVYNLAEYKWIRIMSLSFV